MRKRSLSETGGLTILEMQNTAGEQPSTSAHPPDHHHHQVTFMPIGHDDDIGKMGIGNTAWRKTVRLGRYVKPLLGRVE